MSTITALNGRLPDAVLAVADTGPNGPQRLRTDAAASWGRMLAAGLPTGHLRSGYRDLAAQQREVDRAAAGLTPSAAAPGRSQHGEGLAVDVDEPARTWVRTYGAGYGWVRDRVEAEPWHLEYEPTRDQHATTPAPVPAPHHDDQENDTMSIDARELLTLAYRQELGRDAADAELYDRLRRLARGTTTLPQELDGIADSLEAHRHAVNALYVKRLGRNGSPDELDFQWNANAGNLAAIDLALANSPEARARAGR